VLVVGNLGLSNRITHTVKKTKIQGLNTGTLSTNMYLWMSKYRYIILRDIYPSSALLFVLSVVGSVGFFIV